MEFLDKLRSVDHWVLWLFGSWVAAMVVVLAVVVPLLTWRRRRLRRLGLLPDDPGDKVLEKESD